MAACPRCGAPSAGAVCASCGEALAFAPPAAAVDYFEAGPLRGQGSGWLIASGVIQIVLGACWLIAGIGLAVWTQSGALAELLPLTGASRLRPGVLVVFAGAAILHL